MHETLGSARAGRRAALALTMAAALAVALLAACASEGDKGKPAALVAVAHPASVRNLWQVDLGRGNGFLVPAVLDNAVYAASTRGTLMRIDPSTGKVAWQVEIPEGIAAGVGSDGAVVAVASGRGDVIALDATGKRLWLARVSSDVTSPPLVAHGLVVVRASDHRVSALEADTGKLRWTFQRQQPPLSLHVPAELLLVDDTLVLGFPAGRMDAVALGNGAGRWEAPVSEPKGATEVERLSDVLGAPALAGDELCAASFQGRIGCFDAHSGDLHWAREYAAGAGAGVGAKVVVGVDAGSRLNAFFREGGAVAWQNGSLANRHLSSPAMGSAWVALGDYDGEVHILALEDGSIRARIPVGGGAIAVAPRLWHGALLVQTSGGRLGLYEIGTL